MRVATKLASLLCLFHAFSSALAATTVDAFSPTGVVKQVRQVTARFSGPMVPFGDLRAGAPFEIACPEKGTGRWIDDRNWSYDFERDLPGAVACRFTLPANSKDLSGQALEGQHQFEFSTGGPAVVRSMPGEGARIDEQQIFVLALDAVASDATVAAHTYCRAEGINEKIGLRILAGAERETVLAERKNFVERYLTLYFKARGVVWSSTMKVKKGERDQRPLVVAQCNRTLPADAKVSLVWGTGVAASNGIATTADQVLEYRTRPDFTAKLSCERMKSKAPCIPFLPMQLELSAPIAIADARAIYLSGPGGKRSQPEFGKEQDKASFISSLTFKGPFPEQSSFTVNLPPNLKDDAGRALVGAARFPLAVRTDQQPPLVKFPAPFGIVEARGDRLLPVTVRNVEASLAGTMRSTGAILRVGAGQESEVIAWLKKLANNKDAWEPVDQDRRLLEKSLFTDPAIKTTAFTLPKPLGARAFEVIGIPLRQPGFYVVELASPRLGAAITTKRTAYVHTAALVTNLAAHFKRGAESSLVWVTSLDDAKPVAGAQVAVRDCHAKIVWSGETDASGVARIAQELPQNRCGYNEGFFISARSGADFTFTLSEWQRGIENWRFNLPTGSAGDDTRIVSTVFDRTLLRAGETAHMKHFMRRHTQAGLNLLTSADTVGAKSLARQAKDDHGESAMPDKGVIIHDGTNEKISFVLNWDAAGNASTEWRIPADAKLGGYTVMIGGRLAGEFRVEQFRLPTMRAVLSGPKNAVIAPAPVTLDMQLNYLSGGSAARAAVKLRTLIEPKQIQFADYDDFQFNGSDVKEGSTSNNTSFDEDDGEFEGDDSSRALEEAARTQSLTLDAAGAARITLDKLAPSSVPRDLLAEMSYQDANGATMTASTRVPLWPSQYVIGIKPDGWLLSKDSVKFQVLVLDTAGKPVAGAAVDVDYFERVAYAHRRRLLGGFYAYENSSEIKRLGAACSGKTDQRGLLACDVKAPTDGNLILRAKTADSQQRAASTTHDVWVAGSADWWFNITDNDRIDLLPSKKRFEPGENASFQVRSPFRESTVLITVEREGILDTYVRHLSGREPVFTIPVKPNYAPNVFVSAMVVRGRIAGVQPGALVDLGKPAYKLGIAPIRVGWAAHELKVQVSADKPVYKVRDKATVKVKVTRADGSALPAGAEIALAAVDAALLELKPNTSWDLLEAMMAERSLQVSTSTAQMQVIGKRHFGRKAFPHGGGGGRGNGRELFETLLLWRPKLVLDANGEVTVDVPMNDSLSAFRLVAIASAGGGLFGSGHTEVRTSQDLMLMSGLSPIAREGDRFRAGYTVRNMTAADLKVQLNASVTADGGKPQALAPQSVTLAAGEAKDLGWDYQAPLATSKLAWDINAQAGGGASDRLKITQKVIAAIPVRTMQATLLQLDAPRSMLVQRPADAIAGRGGILTTFSDKLANDLPGVREYMQLYPYTCLEQMSSRAVALHDSAMWRAVVASLPAHLDSDGLAKYFPLMDEGSDSLTAYLLAVSHEAGYTIPPELRERMEQGLRGFVEGKVVRHSSLATTDLAIRKMAALEALSRTSAIKAPMLESITLAPNLWPTSAVIDLYLVLLRSPALPKRDEQLAQTQQIVRARLNLQGTTMGFSTERSDDWWWLMASADVNANRLLLAMLDNPAWQADMGRLARGTLGRQKQGRWGTTLANAWGVLAIDKFSRKFESQPVTGSSSVSLGGASKSVTWPIAASTNTGTNAGTRTNAGTSPATKAGTNPGAGTVMQPWPSSAQTLALSHAGGGKPWAIVQSLAAIPLNAPLSSGYKISKTITPIEQKIKGAWSRGDIYRVHLDLEAQSDMTWVVVDDPVPASASILGTGLGGDSKIMRNGERASTGWVEPAFEERTFDAFHTYFAFVPKGKWSVEYTVRLNNQGSFNLPPTRVEAMYSPEMFGMLPNAPVGVQP